MLYLQLFIKKYYFEKKSHEGCGPMLAVRSWKSSALLFQRHAVAGDALVAGMAAASALTGIDLFLGVLRF